jgi:RNA polymerase sigma factor (sigma-70 family)
MKNNFDVAFSKFIIKNESLINQYENQFDESIIDIKYDIQSLYNSINNISKMSLSLLLNTALNRSINNNMSLIEVMNIIKEELLVFSGGHNSIQRYFNEINQIYKKNDNDYNIEYNQENRDKLIEMNLKCVVSVAKQFQNLGVSLEDLISAGNVGLVVAFDKYNPQRAKLKDNIIKNIESFGDEITFEQLIDAIKEYIKYGDIKQLFQDKFQEKKVYKKKDVIKWVNRNIHNAKFSSVANMWIKAYVMQEIDRNSRIVKKPKNCIQKDREEDGYYRKESIISMDAPINSDTSTSISEVLRIEDDENTDLEVRDAYFLFKETLNRLLEGVSSRDRSIILKKFGIGLPRPMEPKEIAEQEGLSIARVSQIFQTTIAQMRENQEKYNIDPDPVYEALFKII